MSLSIDEIQKILRDDAKPKLRVVPNLPEQTSKFVRWYETEMRCASRRCNSPTYIKLKGIPYCMKHTVTEMDKLLNELTSGETTTQEES